MISNNKNYSGVWPTMITPFTSDNKVDYAAIKNMVEWYIQKGCDGIFAVCQSSEMFYLSEDEKIKIAKTVVETVNHRIKVVASGHTADDINEQIKQLQCMADTNVDAVVLVSNRLAKENESKDVFIENSKKIFDALKNIDIGMYECPYPYKRLLTTDFIKYCAEEDKMVFLKDTCCDIDILKERIDAVKGHNLALLNANTATLLKSLQYGGDGYNGIMGNFHPDIYKWLYHNYNSNNKNVEIVNAFLTVSGVLELRAYPIIAKYFMNKIGLKMDICTRTIDPNNLTLNAKNEINALVDLEKHIRGLICI